MTADAIGYKVIANGLRVELVTFMRFQAFETPRTRGCNSNNNKGWSLFSGIGTGNGSEAAASIVADDYLNRTFGFTGQPAAIW